MVLRRNVRWIMPALWQALMIKLEGLKDVEQPAKFIRFDGARLIRNKFFDVMQPAAILSVNMT